MARSSSAQEKYTPLPYIQKDADGQPIKPEEKATKTAEWLHKVLWKHDSNFHPTLNNHKIPDLFTKL